MSISIRDLLIQCLNSFRHLCGSTTRLKDLPLVLWTDELGRLQLWGRCLFFSGFRPLALCNFQDVIEASPPWVLCQLSNRLTLQWSQAANAGAHKRNQHSLDYKLRDASQLSRQITLLLKDLDRILVDLLISGGKEDGGDDSFVSAALDEESLRRQQQLLGEIRNIIDCLYETSISIRILAEIGLSVSARQGSKSAYEFYDKDHVRSLYPKANEPIVKRLGRAISQRRNHLDHHAQLYDRARSEMNNLRSFTKDDDSAGIVGAEVSESSSDSMGASSQSSFLESSGLISIPTPPWQSIDGKPFECPYCFFAIEIKDRQSWIRHIFRDIRPYICTFPTCSTPNKLYGRRREWHSHQVAEHHVEGAQSALCKIIPGLAQDFQRHVAQHLEELALFALPKSEQPELCDGSYLHTSYAASGTIPDSVESGTSEEEDESDEFDARHDSHASTTTQPTAPTEGDKTRGLTDLLDPLDVPD